MSKILNTDDIMECAAIDMKDRIGIEPLMDAVVEAVDALAEAVADEYDIIHAGATWEGKGFAGLCASFYPKVEGQACPPMIHDGDPDGEWEYRHPQLDEGSEIESEEENRAARDPSFVTPATKWRCPKCGSTDLRVVVSVVMELEQDNEGNIQTIDIGGEHDWGEESHMLCYGGADTDDEPCEYHGPSAKFEVKETT